MSEVRKWLDSIGLAQYGDAFETNDLDVDLLGQVDDQLLKDIGVSSPGHRLRIRNAIAKLSEQEKSASSLGAATDAVKAWCRAQGCSAVSVTITVAGERRHGLSQFYARLGFVQSSRISASATLDA